MNKTIPLILVVVVIVAALIVVFSDKDTVKREGVVVVVRASEFVVREFSGDEFVAMHTAETKFTGVSGQEISSSEIKESDVIEVVGYEKRKKIDAVRLSILDEKSDFVITKYDKDGAFVYPLASRFSVVSRDEIGPNISCAPLTALQTVAPGSADVEISVVRYESVESGTCEIVYQTGETITIIVADTDNENAPINFLEQGVVVNAGSGAYRFVYEAPGAPALTKDLNFLPTSLCYVENAKTDCSRLILKDGISAFVTGTLRVGGVDIVILKIESRAIEGKENTIKLFYYNPDQDKDASGNILCSSKGVVGVERVVPQDITPRAAIELLLRGELTVAERDSGIETEYPLEGLELTNTEIRDRTLVLTFDDALNKTTGGSCRVSILWLQIDATAKQFAGIDKVEANPGTLFQP